MVRVVDMECSVPKRAAAGAEASEADAAPTRAGRDVDRPAGYGMANYGRIFRSRREGGDTRPAMEIASYVQMLARLGIERALPFGTSNEEVAELLRDYPDRFLRLARISALTGMGGVRELERLVRDEGFHALGVSALMDGIPASDRRYYPLYAKAVELVGEVHERLLDAGDDPFLARHPGMVNRPPRILASGATGLVYYPFWRRRSRGRRSGP